MKRHRPPSDHLFEAALYDGQTRIGRIRQRDDGKFIAFDIRDRERGAFSTLIEATRAIPTTKE